MRTIGQERASYALEKVLNLKCDRKDFKSFSAGVPSMILQNGFGQVLAFLLAKGTDKHIVMFEIIKEWLVRNHLAQGEDKEKFVRSLNNMSQQDYLMAQNEALKLLEWVKRYANADLGGE